MASNDAMRKPVMESSIQSIKLDFVLFATPALGSQKGQSQDKVTPKSSRNVDAYSSSSVSARSSRSPFLVMIRRIPLIVTRPSGVALEQIRPRVKCDCGEV